MPSNAWPCITCKIWLQEAAIGEGFGYYQSLPPASGGNATWSQAARTTIAWLLQASMQAAEYTGFVDFPLTTLPGNLEESCEFACCQTVEEIVLPIGLFTDVTRGLLGPTNCRIADLYGKLSSACIISRHNDKVDLGGHNQDLQMIRFMVYPPICKRTEAR
jgi:hypothetical protein